MTSWRQWQANRLNALKSTGPRTEQGKRISRRNAMQHGLTGETVTPGLEDSDDYRGFDTRVDCEGAPLHHCVRDQCSR